MAGTVTLSGGGLTAIPITNAGSSYQLMRGYGPQGAQWNVSWVDSPFTLPVVTRTQVRPGSYYLPVRVLGTSDTTYETHEADLLAMVEQTIWTLTDARGSRTRTYRCSASDWTYLTSLGQQGYDDLKLPQFKQELGIVIPCVRTS